MLQSLKANEIEDGKRSVVVGILDSGVNDLHEDLSANFDRSGSADCTADFGIPDTSRGRLAPDREHTRHARRRNGRGRPQRQGHRWHRARRDVRRR